MKWAIIKDLSSLKVDICEEYEAGNLKGKLKEIASKLKFDDNLVLVLCKLK